MAEVDRLHFLLSTQPHEVQAAAAELQSRGLMFCGHFGYANAVQRLREMNDAFEAGTLYEWLRDTCGIVTDRRNG